MAELLVMAIDIRPGEDQPSRGDVVAVRPDGWAWGNREGPPTFEVVKLPGFATADLEDLLAEEWSSDDTEDPDRRLVRKRRLRLDMITRSHSVKKSDGSRGLLIPGSARL